MKEVKLTSPIRGPNNHDERHEAGEILTVTNEQAQIILNQHAGIIIRDIPDNIPDPEVMGDGGNSRGSGPIFHDSFGSGEVGGVDSGTKGGNVGDGPGRDQQPATKKRNAGNKKG